MPLPYVEYEDCSARRARHALLLKWLIALLLEELLVEFEELLYKERYPGCEDNSQISFNISYFRFPLPHGEFEELLYKEGHALLLKSLIAFGRCIVAACLSTLATRE